MKELGNTIFAQDWYSSHYDEHLYYRQTKNGHLAILVTYVDVVLFSGDCTAPKRPSVRVHAFYKSRDLGVPDKLVGVGISVVHDGITLDQCVYAPSIVVEGIGSMVVRKTCLLLDSGMDLSERKADAEELDASQFPYAMTPANVMFLPEMT